jgi:hypothetical protein
MGSLIRIERSDVTYFVGGEVLGPEDSEAIGYFLTEDSWFRFHRRLRRVLTTLVRPVPKIYGALHWSDGSDLDLLDEKIRNGQAVDADFAGALLTEPRTVGCLACEAEFRVLAVDTGRALFAGTLAERLRRHALKKSCPACGEPWTMLVVEFIDGKLPEVP